MNNAQLRFDPMTGKPLNQSEGIANTVNTNNNVLPNTVNVASTPVPNQVQSVNVATVQPVQTVPTANNTQYVQPTQQGLNTTENQSVQTVQHQTNTAFATQQQMQSIPTVDQNKHEFINNTQANNIVKKSEKKNGPNIVFIVILFAIIFAAIFFLFPYLLENM